MLYSFDSSPLHKDASDEQLMVRIKNHEDNALAELYRKHTPMLRGIMGRIINNDGDIDDLIQEVFLYVWNHAENYAEEKGKALGWIITIAKRRAIDKVRRKLASFRAQERMRLEPASEAYQHTREEANSNELGGIFKKLLSQLPALQREALHLSYYCDMSQREIAASTGIPLGTIKTRLQLALRKIQAAVLAFEDCRKWCPLQSEPARTAAL
jgi:RNA polymerase sigma-70 factor (ECF subfamily)